MQQLVNLPSEEGRKEGNFADRYDLPYSLIKFYGIVNENAAKDTGLTYDDVHKLAEGMWNGTKSLITHSKMEHKPHLLMMVRYKEENYHIGGLDSLIEINTDKKDEELRNFGDVDIDLNEFADRLLQDEKVDTVYLKSSYPISLPAGLKTVQLTFGG